MNPRVTEKHIRRHGGVVVVTGDNEFSTEGGRALRRASVRALITQGRLISGRDGMFGDKPQTYRLLG